VYQGTVYLLKLPDRNHVLIEDRLKLNMDTDQWRQHQEPQGTAGPRAVQKRMNIKIVLQPINSVDLRAWLKSYKRKLRHRDGLNFG
jgi:hypothetical protein